MQVVARSPADAGPFNGMLSSPPSVPIRRDTVLVQSNGYAVLRFRADNPDTLPLVRKLGLPTLTVPFTSLVVPLS
jgi:hypothetical protein